LAGPVAPGRRPRALLAKRPALRPQER
jgi:hypothetical protein